MSEQTKEYVVVFDLLGAETGEFHPAAPGSPPLAVVEMHARGDKVKLTDAQAKRHLEDGAIIAASDKRAKLVQPNPAQTVGVKRDLEAGLTGLVPLEESAPAAAGAEGAKRSTGGKLGTRAELERRSVADLKSLAAEHGVEIVRTDNRKTLAGKLAKVKVGAGTDETVNPGQGKDQSPPPEDQPQEPPAK